MMYIQATITNNVHRGHHTVIFLNKMLSIGYEPKFLNLTEGYSVEIIYKIQDKDLEEVCEFVKREPLGGITVSGTYLVVPDEEKGAKYVGRE